MSVVIDGRQRVLREYELAVKWYVDRDLNRSFDIVHGLVESLEIINRDYKLQVRIIKLYLTLLTIMIQEMISVKILKLNSINENKLNFKEYYEGGDKVEIGDEIWDIVRNKGIYELVEKWGVDKELSILRLVFNLDLMIGQKDRFQLQIEKWLLHEGILPYTDGDVLRDNEEKEGMFKMYLIEVVYYEKSVDGVKTVVNRVIRKDKERFVDWIEQYDKTIQEENKADIEDNSDDDEYDYDDVDDIEEQAVTKAGGPDIKTVRPDTKPKRSDTNLVKSFKRSKTSELSKPSKPSKSSKPSKPSKPSTLLSRLSLLIQNNTTHFSVVASLLLLSLLSILLRRRRRVARFFGGFFASGARVKGLINLL